MNSIILSAPEILDFFEENEFLDQNKFISHLITDYKIKKMKDKIQDKREKQEKKELTRDEIMTLYDDEYLDQNKYISHLIKEFKSNKLKDKIQDERKLEVEFTRNEILTLYNEHRTFLEHKKTLNNLTRDFHKNMQSALNTLKFDKINEFYAKNLNCKCQKKLVVEDIEELDVEDCYSMELSMK